MKRLLKLFALAAALLFFIWTPVKAANAEYVRDDYGLLSGSEIASLNEMAARVADAHDTGIYVRVVNGMENYYTIEDFAEAVYVQEDMGYGSTVNGILLVVDMQSRSYDIFVRNGGIAETAFTTYAREQMADTVANDYLRYGEYYNAFSNYIGICDVDLSYAEAGTPLDEDYDPVRDERERQEKEARDAATRTAKTGAALIVSPITALLTCLGLKSRNKTTGLKTEASEYISGFRLTDRHDQFLYRTETRTRIHTDDDRGGGGGGGFSSSSTSMGSHTSGHF